MPVEFSGAGLHQITEFGGALNSNPTAIHKQPRGQTGQKLGHKPHLNPVILLSFARETKPVSLLLREASHIFLERNNHFLQIFGLPNLVKVLLQRQQ